MKVACAFLLALFINNATCEQDKTSKVMHKRADPTMWRQPRAIIDIVQENIPQATAYPTTACSTTWMTSFTSVPDCPSSTIPPEVPCSLPLPTTSSPASCVATTDIVDTFVPVPTRLSCSTATVMIDNIIKTPLPPSDVDIQDCPLDLTSPVNQNVSMIFRLDPNQAEYLNAQRFCSDRPPGVYCYAPAACGEQCMPSSMISCPDAIILRCLDSHICRTGPNCKDSCVLLRDALPAEFTKEAPARLVYVSDRPAFELIIGGMPKTIAPKRCMGPLPKFFEKVRRQDRMKIELSHRETYKTGDMFTADDMSLSTAGTGVWRTGLEIESGPQAGVGITGATAGTVIRTDKPFDMQEIAGTFGPQILPAETPQSEFGERVDLTTKGVQGAQVGEILTPQEPQDAQFDVSAPDETQNVQMREILTPQSPQGTQVDVSAPHGTQNTQMREILTPQSPQETQIGVSTPHGTQTSQMREMLIPQGPQGTRFEVSTPHGTQGAQVKVSNPYGTQDTQIGASNPYGTQDTQTGTSNPYGTQGTHIGEIWTPYGTQGSQFEILTPHGTQDAQSEISAHQETQGAQFKISTPQGTQGTQAEISTPQGIHDAQIKAGAAQSPYHEDVDRSKMKGTVHAKRGRIRRHFDVCEIH